MVFLAYLRHSMKKDDSVLLTKIKSFEYESQCVSFYLDTVLELQSQFKSSLEEDVSLLGSGGIPFELKMVLTYKIGYKRILRSQVAICKYILELI